MKKIALFIATAMLVGCAGTGVKGYKKNEVLETLNGQDKPSWANEGQPFQISDDKVQAVGVTYIRGDERPEAGSRISAHNAKAQIARSIETRLESIFQQAEEGNSFDSTQAKYIGSEVTKLTTNSVREESMYWERFAQSEEDGSRVIRYRIYSLVTMPKADFERAIREAIAGASKRGKLSKSFQEKVDRHFDHLIEDGVERAPASEEKSE